jgi:pimeloyl-ACP methyl ester carboxylesterase
MKKTILTLVAGAVAAGLIGCSDTKTQSADAATEGAGHYAKVNGLDMYYEVHGEENGKPPLVLLHGALSATGTSFGELVPALAKSRRVIAVEQQAHGHTADIDRPLRIDTMADDTLALLSQIGVEKADFFGYSVGAGIAIDIAVRHPEAVSKLVLASGSYSPAQLQPGLLDGIQTLQPEMLEGSPFIEEYRRIAPRPEDFPKMVERVKDLDANIPAYTPEQIKAIKAPVFLIAADNDIVVPEATVEFYRLLGGGIEGSAGLPASQLAVIPGTSHITVLSQPTIVGPMIGSFLEKS